MSKRKKGKPTAKVADNDQSTTPTDKLPADSGPDVDSKTLPANPGKTVDDPSVTAGDFDDAPDDALVDFKRMEVDKDYLDSLPAPLVGRGPLPVRDDKPGGWDFHIHAPAGIGGALDYLRLIGVTKPSEAREFLRRRGYAQTQVDVHEDRLWALTIIEAQRLLDEVAAERLKK